MTHTIPAPMSMDPTPTSGDVAARERSPLAEMLSIAVPTVATTTSFTLMTFMDKLMVSRLGPDPVYVAAQGNGGLSSWVAISVIFGMLGVVNTFVSQNLGAGKPERAPAYAWNGIWLSAILYVSLIVPFAVVLPWLYAWMRDASMEAAALDAVVRRDEMAATYARVLLFASIITTARQAIQQYFYGMHRPLLVFVSALAGNITNFVCNSLFIYGPGGAQPTGIAWLDAWFAFAASVCQATGIPQLGVVGAAWGTVVGIIVELVICLVVFIGPRFNRMYATRSQWRPDVKRLKELFSVGWAPGLMFGNEMICWGTFMVYYVGHFGAEHSAAGWIAHQWMSLSFMPAVGISVAVTSMVGKCMGMGRPDLAAKRARLGLTVAMVYMGFCGLCFVLFRASLVRFFIDERTSEEVAARLVELGSAFLVATAVFQVFDALAMTLAGALRGAGDTVFVGVMTVVSSWLILVGGGKIAISFFPQMQSVGPWMAAATYIIVLAVFTTARFAAGKWKTIKLVRDDNHPGPDPQATAATVADGVL